MNFAIAVFGSPYGSDAHQHALAFTKAALNQGHNIHRVFFYHEGVYVAVGSRVAPQDEVDVTAEWSKLADQHDFELAVCIANAQKRGVLNKAEAERNDRPTTSLAPGFELVGLGQLIEAATQVDRLIEFPA